MSDPTDRETGFDPTLSAFADFIVGTEYADLPESVRSLERSHILDTLGCMLYGTRTPWVESVIRAVDDLDAGGSVRILGTDRRTSPARAALILGTATHSMDYDDHCQEAGVHAGSATVPTALAVADAADRTITGQDLLTAVAVGTEIGIRSGFAVGYGSVGRGWHIAGWTGAFASAATLAHLRRLDRDRTANALAIAGTQGAGLLGAQYGAAVKRFHMGKATESGYLAVHLSESGLSGDRRIFGSRYGAIGPTMSDDHDAARARRDIGDVYRLLEKLSFKPFPSVGQVHAPVDAVKDLLDREALDPADVESVRVLVPPTVRDHVGWEYEPMDVMSAQSNIQYAIATLLVDGAVTVDAYTADAIDRPAILERIRSIDVIADGTLAEESFGAIVEVHVGDDRYDTVVETPRGYPENPMTDAELEAKFRNQAERVVGSPATDRLVSLIGDLEALDSASTLIDVCK